MGRGNINQATIYNIFQEQMASGEGDLVSKSLPQSTVQFLPPYFLFNFQGQWLSPWCHFNIAPTDTLLSADTASETRDMCKLEEDQKIQSTRMFNKPSSPFKYGIRNQTQLGTSVQFDQHPDLPSDNGESSYTNRRKKPSDKKKKSKRGPQNKNRNILPSMVQQIFSFLSKQNKSRSVCQDIFRALSPSGKSSFDIPRYYYFIKLIKDRQNHYVNEKTLTILSQKQDVGEGLFSKEELQLYLRVARVMAKHFLNNISPYLTLHSKRISQEKRIEHLRTRRALLSLISRSSL